MGNTTATDNHPRNLLVMKASAGSGKTYNLALQYIKHLLFTTDDSGHLVPRRGAADDRHVLNAHRLLLAITFTNKATDQMKERIVRELYNLASPGVKSDYLAGFMADTSLTESRVRELARLALYELLFDYSNFNVSTIDSFFQSILRNFARELDRDFNYDIQLEAPYAVRVAIHNFLLSLGQKDTPTDVDQWVRDYQRHQLRADVETKSWRFFDDGGTFLKFAKEMDSELFRSRMQDVRNYLGKTDDKGEFQSDFSKIRAFKKYLHDVSDTCTREMEQRRDQILAIIQPLSQSLYSKRVFDMIVRKPSLADEKLSGLDSDKIANQFKSKQMPDDAILSQLSQLVADYHRASLRSDFVKQVDDKLGLLGMLGMIDVYLERFRHETNSILIGDTNELIGTVLESGSPFVYERVGTMISHYMIDEFQDTSAKQYENFRGLLRESLSSGNFNMLIGDAKQSIYRFRNADPTVFREKVNTDFARDIYEPPVAPGKPSSVNYRSSRNIISFNNSLFAFVKEQYTDFPAVATTYGDATQGIPADIDEDKVPGYVRIITNNYQLVLNPDQHVEPPTTDKRGKPEPKGIVDVLEVLPQYLLQLHERFPWGKIGILVNSGKDGNKVVERILEYNRQSPQELISIISGESLLLTNSPVVRRIISLLRFIDISQTGTDEDQEDNSEVSAEPIAVRLARKRASDQRLCAALSEFISRMEASHADDGEANGALLEQCLDQIADASAQACSGDASRQDPFKELLQRLLPDGNELTTLVSIVETVIAHLRDSDDMAADVNRETAFLLAFQDTVMQFMSQRNGGSLREFLKFWDEKKDSLSVNARASSDAINIMTIHKAKGLEFECVVIPYADWQLNGNALEYTYWMPDDQFMDTLPPSMLPDKEIVPPLLHVSKKLLSQMGDNSMLGARASSFLDEQQSAVVFDNMNKTYVAMTRPHTELHLFTRGGKNNDVDPFLRAFAEQTDGIMTTLTDAQGTATGWYEYGEISSRELIDSKRHSDPPKARQETLSQYRVSPIPSQLRVRVDHASSASIESGIRLHSLLSRIHDRNDVDRVIAYGLKHGIITADAADPCGLRNVEQHVRRPIMDGNSLVAAWFDPANKVYSERTITTASDSMWAVDGMENLRPDRIVRRPSGEVLVIDYKSGERDDKSNLRQLNDYVGKLRLIFPDVPVSGRLWYIMHDVVLDHKGKAM